MIFPKPKTACFGAGMVTWKDITARGAAEDLFAEAARLMGFSSKRGEAANVLLSVDPTLSEKEGYRIRVEESGAAALSGHDEDAVARGIWTLLNLIERTENGYRIPVCRIEDEAYLPMRGVHLYLPPEDEIDECKQILALIARLKYNAVILEIGGAMKYDRHPEINLAWRKFCRNAKEYAGGPQGMQASQAYWKDSTHVEMADGGSLSKAQVAEIADYCRLLHLEVIPEIQGLSHSYYLTMADRSIAERPLEPFPDSYCPSNERSFELYFDCAEEILEVIHPKRVSIGHDEIRVLGECPLCRGKSGAELLSGEVNRLYAFYAERGVHIMMWGEKLQNFVNFKGFRFGGVEEPERTDRYGRRYYLKETAGAVDLVPKDILMLDWYYSWGNETEKDFCKKGFSEIFGNFRGSVTASFDIRSKSPNVLGAETSTWCRPDFKEMEMNGRFYEMAFSADVLWREGFCDDARYAWHQEVEAFLPEARAFVRGDAVFDGTAAGLAALVLADPAGAAVTAASDQPSVDRDLAEKLAANGLGSAEELHINSRAETLVFFHAAENTPAARETTYQFRDPTSRVAVSYAVRYEDGLTLRIPVVFPTMVGCFTSERTWVRPMGDEYVSHDVDSDRQAVVRQPSPLFAPTDVWRDAPAYTCRIAEFSTAEGIRSVYAYEWKNLRPDVRIMQVSLVNEEKSPISVRLFGIGCTKAGD